jgi:hypothetical protein
MDSPGTSSSKAVDLLTGDDENAKYTVTFSLKGFVGIETVLVQGQWFVKNVDADTESQGVKIGDNVLQINGEPIAGLSEQVGQRMLKDPKRPMKVQLQSCPAVVAKMPHVYQVGVDRTENPDARVLSTARDAKGKWAIHKGSKLARHRGIGSKAYMLYDRRSPRCPLCAGVGDTLLRVQGAKLDTLQPAELESKLLSKTQPMVLMIRRNMRNFNKFDLRLKKQQSAGTKKEGHIIRVQSQVRRLLAKKIVAVKWEQHRQEQAARLQAHWRRTMAEKEIEKILMDQGVPFDKLPPKVQRKIAAMRMQGAFRTRVAAMRTAIARKRQDDRDFHALKRKERAFFERLSGEMLAKPPKAKEEVEDVKYVFPRP